MKKSALLAATVGAMGVLAVALAPAPALAGPLTVVNYSLPDTVGGSGTITTNGYNNYTAPIDLILLDGSKIRVYCADMDHVLQASQYEYGFLTTAGDGRTIDQALSNRIGHIAAEGIAALGAGDLFRAAAAQAVIWDLEYNTTSAFLNLTEFNDAAAIRAETWVNDGTWAVALIPTGGWWQNGSVSQQMITGQLADLPEPASMAVLGMGLAGMVAAKRRRRV